MAYEPKVKPEVLDLVLALAQRVDIANAAEKALQQRYPEAPPAMIVTAKFHVATDGVGAAFDWLAAVESFLRNPEKGLDFGATYHLLYHLYNWQQFQVLLPNGRAGVLEWINQAKELLAEGDTAAVGAALTQLESMFDGGLTHPDFRED